MSINLKANGNVKLEMLEAFDTDIISSGAVTLNAAMTGTTSRPAVNGRLQLRNASFNMLSLPNGLSDAMAPSTLMARKRSSRISPVKPAEAK